MGKSLTSEELATLVRLLESESLNDLILGLDICKTWNEDWRVRKAFVDIYSQIRPYMTRTNPRTGEKWAELQLALPDILTPYERTRLEKKVAGEVIGLRDTVGDVVIPES